MVIDVGHEAMNVPSLFERDGASRKGLLITNTYSSVQLQVLLPSESTKVLQSSFAKQCSSASQLT